MRNIRLELYQHDSLVCQARVEHAQQVTGGRHPHASLRWPLKDSAPLSSVGCAAVA
jgi:hypothetical protein